MKSVQVHMKALGEHSASAFLECRKALAERIAFLASRKALGECSANVRRLPSWKVRRQTTNRRTFGECLPKSRKANDEHSANIRRVPS